VLNAPVSFTSETSQLTGVEIATTLRTRDNTSFAIAFAITQEELDTLSKMIAAATKGDAIVWIAYPKQRSKKYSCEFSRDSGWTALAAAGFEPVRQVALDEDWSALRFRRVEYIKTMTRSFAMTDAGKAKAKKSKA
jgi:hypothetical protein